MSGEYKNFINGKWRASKSGKRFENRNPANQDDLIGTFPDSDATDVNDAVVSAKKAYPVWKKIPAPRRGEILLDVMKIMAHRKEELAKLMTREMGKVLQETRGDVQEGIDTAHYFSGEGRRLFGQTTPTELPNKFAMSIRQPIGVCGMITPWNFPIAIPTWKIFPALICGNTCVLKSAPDTPASAAKLMEILQEAGIPDGVVNLVSGGGETAGAPLVDHPDVSVISFTGSSAVGKQINSRAGAKLKRVSLELGGKNAQIVMDDADLDLAVEGALWGAFATTGQRCTATSRIIVQKSVKKKFIEKLLVKTAEIKTGDGLRESNQVGPIINLRQMERVLNYIEIGKKEGARLLCGGRRYTGKSYDKGFFVEPTIFDKVTPMMRISQEEIFGPVTCIIEFGTLEEAIEILNGTVYGLSSSIYTADVNRAFKAIEDIEAGITYINGPTIGAEVHLPFGGVKETGNGHRESGVTVLDIYSEWKSIYVDFSGRLQKAQIDTGSLVKGKP